MIHAVYRFSRTLSFHLDLPPALVAQVATAFGFQRQGCVGPPVTTWEWWLQTWLRSMSTASVCSRWQERWSRATWRWPTKFHVGEYGMYCKIFGPSNRYGIMNACTHTYTHVYIYIYVYVYTFTRLQTRLQKYLEALVCCSLVQERQRQCLNNLGQLCAWKANRNFSAKPSANKTPVSCL